MRSIALKLIMKKILEMETNISFTTGQIKTYINDNTRQGTSTFELVSALIRLKRGKHIFKDRKEGKDYYWIIRDQKSECRSFKYSNPTGNLTVNKSFRIGYCPIHKLDLYDPPIVTCNAETCKAYRRRIYYAEE